MWRDGHGPETCTPPASTAPRVAGFWAPHHAYASRYACFLDPTGVAPLQDRLTHRRAVHARAYTAAPSEQRCQTVCLVRRSWAAAESVRVPPVSNSVQCEPWYTHMPACITGPAAMRCIALLAATVACWLALANADGTRALLAAPPCRSEPLSALSIAAAASTTVEVYTLAKGKVTTTFTRHCIQVSEASDPAACQGGTTCCAGAVAYYAKHHKIPLKTIKLHASEPASSALMCSLSWPGCFRGSVTVEPWPPPRTACASASPHCVSRAYIRPNAAPCPHAPRVTNALSQATHCWRHV
jgi:hypothetical protein